ncbi:hypothetical protein TPY_1922 [Sulfobacillus acidophilus TPY]|uniref:Aldose 1-epimerase n=1 Tax=Sulfobacillus acidophilus (strain ATCC 700253 / DSM 10332 / NAL) TaxID=679936 RepID=G8TSZ4_SULAD|nr:hypothetical protein TPY_1922 [Sulfobacillus acidophilus TPY]AEW05609.1 Aldose 1-epimerase [Sulfobacillus acidophilus DSM 10332]
MKVSRGLTRTADESWILENDGWRMTVVPDWGGQITSLVYRPLDEELLRSVDSRPMWQAEPYVYGIPLLFPPGRIRGGTFEWQHVTYRWPTNDTKGPNHLHGFVWDLPWEVADTARGLTIVPSTLARQRFHDYLGSQVDVRVTYSLEAYTVRIRVVVTNEGPAAIPFGWGFHTTWNLAGHDWRVTLPAGQEWAMGHDGMPSGALLPELQVLRDLDRGRPAGTVVADTCYRLADGVDPAVWMRHPSRPVAFAWRPDPSFRHLVIYRPSLDSAYICVEPYTWTHNAVNLSLPPTVTGVDGLNPGERRQLDYTVEVSMDEVSQ